MALRSRFAAQRPGSQKVFVVVPLKLGGAGGAECGPGANPL